MTFPITGTLINVGTVILGGTMGTILGNRLPEKMRETVLQSLGLMVVVVGLSMAITTHNILIPLFSVLIGGILGEAIDLDAALARFGQVVEARAHAARAVLDRRGRRAQGKPGTDPEPANPAGTALLVEGFITASLVFCVGPMTVLGSIQDGLMGDYKLLAIKALMDGFASAALAASLGAGVILSALTVLGFQGGLSLLAALFAAALGGITPATPWVVEMTATGGVVILSIAFILLDIKRIRVANLLPAVFIAPLIVLALARLGVGY